MQNFSQYSPEQLDTDVFSSLDTSVLGLPSSQLVVSEILIPSKQHHWDPKFHVLPVITGGVSLLSL